MPKKDRSNHAATALRRRNTTHYRRDGAAVLTTASAAAGRVAPAEHRLGTRNGNLFGTRFDRPKLRNDWSALWRPRPHNGALSLPKNRASAADRLHDTSCHRPIAPPVNLPPRIDLPMTTIMVDNLSIRLSVAVDTNTRPPFRCHSRALGSNNRHDNHLQRTWKRPVLHRSPRDRTIGSRTTCATFSRPLGDRSECLLLITTILKSR